MVHHRCYVLPSFVPYVSHEHASVAERLIRSRFRDVAVVSIIMYAFDHMPQITINADGIFANRLSWADTAASTIGRLWGRYTPPLPRRIPYTGISYAPRKSTGEYLPIPSVLITAIANRQL